MLLNSLSLTTTKQIPNCIDKTTHQENACIGFWMMIKYMIVNHMSETNDKWI